MTTPYREFENFATMQSASGGGSGRGGGGSLLQNIADNLQLFMKNVSALERKINLLDTPQDSTSLRREIIEMVNDTVQLAKLTRISIDRAKDKSHSFLPPEKMQFNRLTSGFQNSVSNFLQIQQSTSALEQEMLKKARSASTTTRGSPDSLPESERGGGSSSYEVADQNFRVQRQAQMETDSTALVQREREIHQLEHDILDINDIFRDLGTMVHEQGDMIDNIESNVDTTAVRVVAGNEQLVKAVRHKRCSRKLTVIIVCVVIGVLVAIIIAAIILICAVGGVCRGK